jgi:hypothetical protein
VTWFVAAESELGIIPLRQQPDIGIVGANLVFAPTFFVNLFLLMVN